MSTPKQHHYVPRWLQHHFKDNKGRIHAARRDQFGNWNYFSSKAGNLFSQNELYTINKSDGQKDYSLETELYSPLDSEAASLHRYLIPVLNAGFLPSLGGVARQLLWSFFVYHAYRRHPDSYDDFEQFVRRPEIAWDTAGQSTTNTIARIELAAHLQTLEYTESEIKSARNEARKALSENMLNHMTSFNVQFGIIDDESDSFVLPDRPIFDAPRDNFLLGACGSRLWVPISSRYAIAPNGVGTVDEIVRLNSWQTRAINEFLALSVFKRLRHSDTFGSGEIGSSGLV